MFKYPFPFKQIVYRLHFWLRESMIAQDFHIVNIILHAIVSMLLLPVFNILLDSKEKRTAFYATALFAVHPVHTEAVCNFNCIYLFKVKNHFYSFNLNKYIGFRYCRSGRIIMCYIYVDIYYMLLLFNLCKKIIIQMAQYV